MTTKIFLAPLQGLTDQTYRRIFPEYFPGIDRVYTPYFSINSQTMPRKRKIQASLNAGSNHFEVVPQVLTNSATAFVTFSGIIKEMGIEMLNLNMGCPYPVVTKKGKGAAMLSDPGSTVRFFEEVFAEIQMEVSIKVRLGFHHKQEIHHLIPLLNRFPIREIIVHPRIGTDYYEGTPDIEAFSRLKNITDIPLIYNGDIFSVNDYENLKNVFPELTSIMMGRGLLRNPLLAGQIKNIAVDQPVTTVRAFIHDLAEGLSHDRGQGQRFPQGIKEHWWHLAHNFIESKEVFNTIKVVNDMDTYHKKVDEIFGKYHFGAVES